MLAPFNLEFQMMRRDPIPTAFMADPLVNPRVHALNKLIAGQASPGIDGPTKLAVDDVAHAFKHPAHQSLGQDCVPPLFRL